MSDIIISQDAPMNCCGMIQGYGFNESFPTGKTKKVRNWGGGYGDGWSEYPEYRMATKEDQKTRLQQLIDTSRDNQRNCVMIVLADGQGEAIEAAKEMGFQTIQTFWNPNSGNNCYIMTYLHFGSYDDYEDEWE